MKRTVLTLTVVALAPLLMGGGGSPPPRPENVAIVGPKVEGIFVMDPHETDLVTPLARHGAVYLRYKRVLQPEKLAAAVFTIPSTFQLLKGCDTSFTDFRFVNTQNRANALSTFIAQTAYIRPLFAELGITVTANMVPVITKVKKQACTTGGTVPGIDEPFDGVGKGMFWMVVEIQFQREVAHP
jgi:hypothetical protein